MNKTKIVMVKVEDIKPYEKNPRINDGAVESIANSIKEFGFKVPIVLDKNNVIINGHTRLKASIKLGLKQVPCIIASDLTEEQVTALRIADNKTSELAEWDYNKLSQEIQDIGGNDWVDFGFAREEMMLLTGEEQSDEEFEIVEDYEEDFEKVLNKTIAEKEEGRLIITYENEQERDFLRMLLKESGELKETYKASSITEE